MSPRLYISERPRVTRGRSCRGGGVKGCRLLVVHLGREVDEILVGLVTALLNSPTVWDKSVAHGTASDWAARPQAARPTSTTGPTGRSAWTPTCGTWPASHHQCAPSSTAATVTRVTTCMSARRHSRDGHSARGFSSVHGPPPRRSWPAGLARPVPKVPTKRVPKVPAHRSETVLPWLPRGSAPETGRWSGGCRSAPAWLGCWGC